jgi:DNA-binding GntR family transcriptional regulator
LVAEGLVKTIPQKGAVVASPSIKEAEELYEIRALLEGLAARQFTERASDKEMKALHRTFNRMARTFKASAGTLSMLQAKNAFYDVLFDGAHNPTLRSLLGMLQARIAVLRAMSLAEPGRSEASLHELEALMQAIEERNPNGAAEACASHVKLAGDVVLAALKLQEKASEKGPDT